MILDSMFFSFDDQFYKQKFEFSMRLSLSLVATDLVMQYARVGDSIVEYKFQDTTFIIRRWYPSMHLNWNNNILDIFNAYHTRLVHLEVGDENKFFRFF